MVIVDTYLLLAVLKIHDKPGPGLLGETWGGASTTDRSEINDLGGRRDVSSLPPAVGQDLRRAAFGRRPLSGQLVQGLAHEFDSGGAGGTGSDRVDAHAPGPELRRPALGEPVERRLAG